MTTSTHLNVKALEKSPATAWWISASLIVGFALLTAVAAKIAVPIPGSPVPVTLQTLVVLLAGMVLGSKRGALSQITLIGMGLVGLPVFSTPLPGTLVLMGPTGGYILGFAFAAFASGLLFERMALKSVWAKFIALFATSFFILVPGVIWLSVFTGGNFSTAIMAGLVPFLWGDVVKCAAVALAGSALRR